MLKSPVKMQLTGSSRLKISENSLLNEKTEPRRGRYTPKIVNDSLHTPTLTAKISADAEFLQSFFF